MVSESQRIRHKLYMREYKKRDSYKKMHVKVVRKWRSSNRAKSNAHQKVNRAVTSGKLIRPLACDNCGIPCEPHAHHDDYSKALDVKWLCVECHSKLHNDLESKVKA